MLVVMSCTLLVTAPITCVGGIILALHEDVGLVAAARWSASRCSLAAIGLIIAQHGAAVPGDAAADRHGQPGAARADRRHPGRARVRPRARTRPSGSRAANTDLTTTRSAVGRLQALDLPDGDARAELLERRRAVVRRAPRRERRDPDRHADRVPQLPDPDPDVGHDGHVHVDHGAARRRLRRAHHRGARHRLVDRAARRPGDRSCPTPRPSRRAARRRVPATRARPRRCSRTSPSRASPGQTTAIIGSTGAGKTTLVSISSRACSTPPAGRARRRRGRARARPRTRCGAASAWCRRSRTCSPARSRATCATATRDATDEELWRCLEIAQGTRLRRGDARPARRADRAGRHQRVGRAAPAAGDRAGARPRARRSTCSTTRSRRSTSAPTPGCARALAPARRRRRRDHRRPAGVDDHRRRPDRGARRRRSRRAPARHAELLATCPTYAEIVSRRPTEREAQHERQELPEQRPGRRAQPRPMMRGPMGAWQAWRRPRSR